MNALAALPVQLQALAAGALALGLLLLLLMGLGLRQRKAELRRLRAQLDEQDEHLQAQQTELNAQREAAEAARQRAETAAQGAQERDRELRRLGRRLNRLDALAAWIEFDAEGQPQAAGERFAQLAGDGRSLHFGAGGREALASAQPWCGDVELPSGEVLLMQLQPTGDGRVLGLGLPQTAAWRQRRELQAALARRDDYLLGQQAGGWAWTAASGRVRLDRAALQLLGLPAAGSVEMGSEAWLARWHPDDAEAWRLALERLQSGRDAPLQLPLRVAGGEGAWRTLQLRGGAVQRDADGRPLRLAGVLLPPGESLAPAEAPLARAALQQLGATTFRWQPQADHWQWDASASAWLGLAEAPAALNRAQALQAFEPAQALAAGLQALADGQQAALVLDGLQLRSATGRLRPLRLQAWRDGAAVAGLLLPPLLALDAGAPAPVLLAPTPSLPWPEASPPSADWLARARQADIDWPRGLARFQERWPLYRAALQGLVRQAEAWPGPAEPGAQLAVLAVLRSLAATLGCERLSQWSAAGLQRLRAGQALDPAWCQAFDQQRLEALALLRELS